MKKLLLVLLLGITATASGAADINPVDREMIDGAKPTTPVVIRPPVVTLGTEVPFPFGTEIPFPWSSIEGVWEVRDREIDAYFSFQVQRDEEGSKLLKVLHIDKVSRNVVGEGAGFANPEQKIVRAVMKSDVGNYLVFVRVFRDMKNAQGTRLRTATVLTIRYFGTSDMRDQHYILRKVSNRPLDIRND